MKRLPLISRFALFIALCASLAYWAMQMFKAPVRPVAIPQRIEVPEVNLDQAARVFGGAVAAASEFQLQGVVLAGNPEESVAIIAVGGKPAQAFPLNAEVAPGVIVKEVHAQYALLSEGGVSKRVELPIDSKAGQGNASPASNAPVPVRPSPPPSPSPSPSQQMPAPEPRMPAQPPPPPGTTPQPVVPTPGVGSSGGSPDGGSAGASAGGGSASPPPH